MVTTVYFLANEQELSAACPGWRVPLPAPRKKQATNPFTGEPMDVQDYDPLPGVPFASHAAGVAYEPLPHAELSGIDVIRLGSLMQLLVPQGDWTACYRPARVGPPEGEVAVCAVPAELVSALATTPEADMPHLNSRWVQALRDEATQIEDLEARTVVLAGLEEAACLPMLLKLRELARQGVLTGRSLQCFMAP